MSSTQHYTQTESRFDQIGSGFTLIELMVAITIVAILAILALLAYSNVQKRGRDSKRQSDLSTIQSALEQYHADQNYYPILSLSSSTSISYLTTNYLSVIPVDPINATLGRISYSYLYQALPSSPACDNTGTGKYCIGYCLYANLEILSSQSLPASCTTSGYNYVVSSP